MEGPYRSGPVVSTRRSAHSPLRCAWELRHESWLKDETAELLRRHQAAACLADRGGMLEPLRRTAEWGYVRFHEGKAQPWPRYGQDALRRWAERIAEEYGPDRTVCAYFNNDPHGCAPRDALEFAEACCRAGLRAPLLQKMGEAAVMTTLADCTPAASAA